MLSFRTSFASRALETTTSMSVILPTNPVPAPRPRVLYLFHGNGDDDTVWIRQTSIERYASRYGLAVVMPYVGTSFCCNEVHGRRYWDFVNDELPNAVASAFNVSTEPCDTFVAGLSMGGFGALKLALSSPQRFAVAGSLSGALDMRQSERSPDSGAVDSPIWGDRPIAGTGDDLVSLVGRADPAALPRLWVGCGLEDEIVVQNRTFLAAAHAAGVPVTEDWRSGGHSWAYWDAAIQRFLAFAMD